MQNQSLSSSSSTNSFKKLTTNSKIFKDIHIKCPKGKQGYVYCLDCKFYSVMCNNENQCPCYTQHINCQHFKRISTFNNALQNKLKPSKILDKISQLTQQIINNVSKLQQTIREKYFTFGLNKADKQISQKIINYSNGFKHYITSKDFIKYQQQTQQQQQKWFINQTNMFNNLVYKVSIFVGNHFKQIKQLIYYQHMENTKNKNQILFLQSNILSKDQKNTNSMLNMLQDVGPISKLQKVYSIQQDQFSSYGFYTKCYNKKNLLYLIKNSYDKIYGSYCPVQINKLENTSYSDYEKKTFLFELLQKQKSKVLKSDNILHINSIASRKQQQQRLKTNNDRIMLLFGDPNYPNLIVSQYSQKVQRNNYIIFDNKDSNNPYFQKKQLKTWNNNNRKKYTIKQFQIFEITFEKQ